MMIRKLIVVATIALSTSSAFAQDVEPVATPTPPVAPPANPEVLGLLKGGQALIAAEAGLAIGAGVGLIAIVASSGGSTVSTTSTTSTN